MTKCKHSSLEDCLHCKHIDCIITEREIILTKKEREILDEVEQTALAQSKSSSERQRYYWKDVDKSRKRSLESYYRHKEQRKQKQMEYYQENKDFINAKRRAKRKKQREEMAKNNG